MKLKGAPSGGRGAGCAHSLLTPTGWHLGKDSTVRTRSSEDQGHCRAGSAQALGAPCAHPHGTGWQEALCAPQPGVEPLGSGHSRLPQPQHRHRKASLVLSIPGVFLRCVAPQEMKDGQIGSTSLFPPLGST